MPTNPALERRVQADQLRVGEIRRQREQEIELHVRAIKSVRADVEAKIRELTEHCEGLQRSVRRLQGDNGEEGKYRVYGTAHTRLAGALHQAMNRANAMDRLLEARQEGDQERARREREAAAEERVKAAVRGVFDLQLPRENDFELLFGEEAVADAS